jgi:hypothetical protein
VVADPEAFVSEHLDFEETAREALRRARRHDWVTARVAFDLE